MSTLTIRRALDSDVGSLGIVGPAAYAAAYGYLWDRPDAMARQLESFNSQAFRDFFERADTAVWVATFDEIVVGFLSLVTGSADPITKQPGGLEIPRIYLLPGAQNRGLGKMLLQAAIDEVQSKNHAYVWLDVMESAGLARTAYENWGFQAIGKAIFDKGVNPDLSAMVIYRKNLEKVAV